MERTSISVPSGFQTERKARERKQTEKKTKRDIQTEIKERGKHKMIGEMAIPRQI